MYLHFLQVLVTELDKYMLRFVFSALCVASIFYIIFFIKTGRLVENGKVVVKDVDYVDWYQKGAYSYEKDGKVIRVGFINI